jgi:5-methylcytosine-specific restriction endonuclease McrA
MSPSSVYASVTQSAECQFSNIMARQKLSFTPNNCSYCEKPILAKEGRSPYHALVKKFCNARCRNDFSYRVYIEKWKAENTVGTYATSNHIKRYMIETYGNQCVLCGWCVTNPSTGNVPIALHHIDGNYKNNLESNLQLLCPNCHSLTSNYGSLNIGNGRVYGKKYRVVA